MRFTRLADWLAWQEQLHPTTIELGLERAREVLLRLGWRPTCPAFIVGGTNGKGSCVALLDAMLSAGGYRVGAFTSPHLIRYNERIKIAGCEISDASLIAAFERIDAARGDISLTFFEFNALAALLIFETAGLDAMILEVGLGGRLDAVNLIDADVALISSVALDHCDWLGSDVESIAREKAGIFRAGRTAIFGSLERPAAIEQQAQRIGARLLCLGRDFTREALGDRWHWRGLRAQQLNLPRPALAGDAQFDNAAAVLAALESVSDRLPLSRAQIESGLRAARLPGRFQIVAGQSAPVEWILDVAHNPAAAKTLADNLAARACAGRTLAVCGMLSDKDVDGVIAQLRGRIDEWIVAGVSGGARALAPVALADKLLKAGERVAQTAATVISACEAARAHAHGQDRIVVFGSFHTVGPALEWLGC